MIYNLHRYYCNLQKLFTAFRKKNKNNKKKTFPIKMKENVEKKTMVNKKHFQ